MPRTLAELRAGRLAVEDIAPIAEHPPALAEVEVGPSLDQALDELLSEALTAEDEGAETVARDAAIPIVTAAEFQALRQVTESGQQQIESEERNLEDLKAEMRADEEDLAQTEARIAEYQQEINNIRHRMTRYERYIVGEREHSENTEARMLLRTQVMEQMGERVQGLQDLLLQNNRRAAADGQGNFARVFGTREDIQREDYVSPITNMFQSVNDWGRRRALEARAQPTAMVGERPGHGNAVLVQMSQGQAAMEVRQDASLRQHDTPPMPFQFRSSEVAASRGSPPQTPPGLSIPPWGRVNFDSAVFQNNSAADTPARQLSSPPGLGGGHTTAEIDTNEASRNSLLSRQLNPLTGFGPRSPNNDEEGFNIRNSGNVPPSILGQPIPVSGYERFRAQMPRTQRRTTQSVEERMRQVEASIAARAERQEQIRNDFEAATRYPAPVSIIERRHRVHNQRPSRTINTVPPPLCGLDIKDDRPDARSDEEMMMKVDCKICLSQIADTACLPCGHLCMCRWCADQIVPVKKEDQTRPERKGIRCPICREGVKSRVKLFVI